MDTFLLPVDKEPFIQPLADDLFDQRELRIFIRREDVLHPLVSGNKWRKLKYNLQLIRNYKGLVTFGGAYSNHIYATAAACHVLHIPCHGIIRGERSAHLSPTLEFAEHAGMKLHFTTRSGYHNKGALIDKFFGKNHDWFVLPEGGTNRLALKGCAEIIDDKMREMDIVCCPVGTGGTMAGIITADGPRVIGYSALKADLTHVIADLLAEYASIRGAAWEMVNDFHFGGYAKISDELIHFIRDFKEKHAILLDPVYTGKMMFGIYEMAREGLFPAGSHICAIHTGGLQGWAGIRQRKGIDPATW